MKGVTNLFPDQLDKGIAKISKFEITEDGAKLYNLRLAINNQHSFFVRPGFYCRLKVNNQIMMTDTPMERNTNREFSIKANGHVLIAGLGIGLIIQAIMDKPEVKSITVIEKYQDVIDIVSPKFKGINIICADIFNWMPEKGKKWDTIYFDIWPDICKDNLQEIKILHNKFKNKLNRNNPNNYMDSWLKSYLKRL